MSVDITNTISELAVAAPGAIRVFEQFGIDYCCGGSRTLESACQKLGVPAEEVLRSIEQAERALDEREPGIDWRTESMSALCEHIVATHHVFTREELVRMERLLEKVTTRHGANHPELTRLGELFLTLKQELLPHMLKEEQILFPYIERLEAAMRTGRDVQPPFFATVLNPVRMMTKDHEAVGELLSEMRSVTDNYTTPPDGCMSFDTLFRSLAEFEADLHQHIHLENNVLFPRAIAMESSAKPSWQEAGTSEHHCFGH